jgi:hypothetical protein
MDPFAPLPCVLSIDFDGVLHPVDAGDILLEDGEMKIVGSGLFIWASVLERMLAPFPHVHLCIHSSWRHMHTLDELAALLPEGLALRLADSTMRGLSRHESIRCFALDHQVQHLAILDDMASEFEPDCLELILCDPSLGISEPSTRQKIQAWLDSLPTFDPPALNARF